MIYLVTGTFRSGTSLMMQGLEAGGLPVYRSAARDQVNDVRTRPASRPNPVSLYEPSTRDLDRVGFPRMYDEHAVKLVLGWLGSLAVHAYRVVLLTRDPHEIVDSYENAFQEYWDAPLRARWISTYWPRIDEAQRWFDNRRDVHSLTTVGYDDLRAKPEEVFGLLARVGFPILVEGAAAVVHPAWRLTWTPDGAPGT